MLSEACQRVATLQLGSNCCNFIAIFIALRSATQKCEQALKRPTFLLPTLTLQWYHGVNMTPTFFAMVDLP